MTEYFYNMIISALINSTVAEIGIIISQKISDKQKFNKINELYIDMACNAVRVYKEIFIKGNVKIGVKQ